MEVPAKKKALQRSREKIEFTFFLMQKTKKSIAKRFKKTGTGKLMRRSPNTRHLLRNKSNKARRRRGNDKRVDEGFEATFKSAMPFA